jgi:hypothetical protein
MYGNANAQYLSDIYVEERDTSQPLWAVHVLNNLEGERHAMIMQVDHALGDGTCMVEALLSMFDDTVSIQRWKGYDEQAHAMYVSSYTHTYVFCMLCMDILLRICMWI